MIDFDVYYNKFRNWINIKILKETVKELIIHNHKYRIYVIRYRKDMIINKILNKYSNNGIKKRKVILKLMISIKNYNN